MYLTLPHSYRYGVRSDAPWILYPCGQKTVVVEIPPSRELQTVEVMDALTVQLSLHWNCDCYDAGRNMSEQVGKSTSRIRMVTANSLVPEKTLGGKE